MSAWRELDAYVLLGDPGAGKSAVFEMEARAGSDTHCVSAREFIIGFSGAAGTRVFFIDGLDEERAGGRDGRGKLDEIIVRLMALGRPKFRLSCRAADWLGHSDARALKAVSPDLKVLQLLPLDDREIVTFLGELHGVADPEAFVDKARSFGIGDLLRNPLLLRLTADAVNAGAASGGAWPASRHEVYQRACEDLVAEHSDEHRVAERHRDSLPAKARLAIAGQISAVLLLAGADGVADLAGPAGRSLQGVVTFDQLGSAIEKSSIVATLSTKLFTTVNGRSVPLHRSIAEFLAARYLAFRLDEGLPLDRLLALCLGGDGRPVAPLRGLIGWLASIRQKERDRLISLDPLAVVLNGDVAALDGREQTLLLDSLAAEPIHLAGDQNERQRYLGHALAPLALAPMVPTLTAYLSKDDPGQAHQRLLSWILEGLLHGPPVEGLAASLEALVTSEGTHPENRADAFRVWSRTRFDRDTAFSWLERLRSGAIEDPDRTLLGCILDDVYPAHLEPSRVFDYLLPAPSYVPGSYWSFWCGLVERTPAGDLAELAQGWVGSKRQVSGAGVDASGIDLARLIEQLSVALLAAFGETAPLDVLDGWLRLGIDEHGHSVTEPKGSSGIADWLEQHPRRFLDLLAHGYAREARNGRDEPRFWRAERLLHGARLPRSSIRWQLEQAASAMGPALARHHLMSAARMVVDRPLDFDSPPLEAFEATAEGLSTRFPEARHWLEKAWTSEHPGFRTEQWARRREREIEKARALEERRAYFAPRMAGLLNGEAPLAILIQVATAFDNRYFDLSGRTGEERVAALLATDVATAQQVVRALEGALDRDDLPGLPGTLACLAKGEHRAEGSVFLFAAARAFERDPESLHGWSDERVRRLVALDLANRINRSDWMLALAVSRPDVVSAVIDLIAESEFRRLGKDRPSRVVGLLSGDVPGIDAVIEQCLAPVLAVFPPRLAGAQAISGLNRMLASISRLDPSVARRLVAERLEDKRLAAGQRSCWLVARLGLDGHAADQLVDWMGRNERRAVTVGDAIVEQRILGRLFDQLAPTALALLIEALAPISPAGRPIGAYQVDAAMRRGDAVAGLVSMLEGDPSTQAGQEIDRLLNLDKLTPWRQRLGRAQSAQRAFARDTSFQWASPEAVLTTLANRCPANPADLQALILDHLTGLENELRGSDTQLLRQLWGFGARKPLDENNCRDLVLDKLRDRLRLMAVSLHREASAAGDRRADMQAAYVAPGIQIVIPIEVKKDAHRDLWTAWREQLDKGYANDPAAGGFGIYLVLWFNQDPGRSPKGLRPRTAAELQSALQQGIPEADRRRLAVRVMDLSIDLKAPAPAAPPAPPGPGHRGAAKPAAH